ncbi:DUF4276 family protein [Bradymonas sediminis]|uniref:Uncharacterized protein n=1 Tax=Bradymonas sediminis TaxID=1548548 RepID=A0A2Z4FQV8_9DELT|nr:DUF4276 family protein [Bradymonas sediminis]AWV90998.1 hypothetical protein DN745_17360 [Bradymonas sediminis]TDP75262.1 uncharacterized protein DUF4276 [Bradymonas sediminis]
MTRVHVICEGQTEETFVNELLCEPFAARKIYLQPSQIGKPRHKGGNFKVERLITDLRNRLRKDRNCYCTTFFDFYGLPADFPGKREASAELSAQDKANCLIAELQKALSAKFDHDEMRRFIPYVQMYEFEGLLFSDPERFARGIDQPHLASEFSAIREDFSTPEEINNSPMTAPSKRIEGLYRRYEKPLHGSLAALEIGLATIRAECPIFDGWLERLEGL